MSLWIKICGNRRSEDAVAAAEAGADAVGFVFAAASPRQAEPQTVVVITPLLAGRVESIGVFVESSADEIARIVDQCGLTGVQLHGGSGGKQAASAEVAKKPRSGEESTAQFLRARFGSDLRIVRVVHFGPQTAAQLEAIAQDGLSDAALIDTRVGQFVGGTGVPFDWQTAAKTIFAGSQGLRLIAAGGLKPENVVEAVNLMNPWGLDVSSGVEARPGIKNHGRIREFIRLARQVSARPR